MLTALLLIAGFVLLVKGADWLVSGASALASRFGVSALVIGLTVVAFGTSAPELVVNLVASLQGSTDIAIGNVVGSNTANILLILGIAAIIYPLTVQKGTVWKEIPFAFLASTMLAVLANDALIDGASTSLITRIDGMVLVGFFIIFLYYIFGIAFASPESTSGGEAPEALSATRSLSLIALGLACLVLGGKWIVDGAVAVATLLGVSEALIGLTIVAVGTSLPELATSAVAAYRRQVDIAVGNIVGSNIFNIFWILGISALLSPLPLGDAMNVDIIVSLGATLLLFLALFVGSRHTIDRWQGVFFVLTYGAYVAFLVYRG